MQKLAGILFSLGAVVTFIGAFRPINLYVFGTDNSPQLKAEYIATHPTDWLLSNTLFSAGAVLAALGVLVFARQVQNISESRNIRIASYLGGAMALVGGMFFAIICNYRIAMEPQALMRNIDVMPWMFWASILLTAFALLIVGVVLLLTGYPKWLGWLVLGLEGWQLVWHLRVGGVPGAPAFIFLPLGIALLLMRSRSPQPSLEPAQRKEARI